MHAGVLIALCAIACQGGKPPSAAEATTASVVFDVRSEVTCALVGEGYYNPQTLQPGLQFLGADMGVATVVGTRLYLMFGDVWTRSQACNPPAEPYLSLKSDDVLASMSLDPAPDPDLCLPIEFPTAPDDPSRFEPIELEHDGSPIDLLDLGIPSAAFTHGGRLHAIFNPSGNMECETDDDCAAAATCISKICIQRGLGLRHRPIIAASRAVDGMPSSRFGGLAELTSPDFVNVTARTINALDDYGNDAPTQLIVFGRKHYVTAPGAQTPWSVFLMRLSLDALDGPARYFAGYADDGAPRWSSEAAEAQAVIESSTERTSGDDDPVPIRYSGTMSVSVIPPLGPQGYRWLLTYGGRPPAALDFYGAADDARLGIFFRLARDPWGPWTRPALLYGAVAAQARGELFYHPDFEGVHSDADRTPVECEGEPYEDIGVEYAPQVIERFTRLQGQTLILHWLMSTWNPYRVVQMRSEIRVDAATGDAVAP